MIKKKYTGIILLMSISLMGIIGVQLFWMKNAIDVAQGQFDKDVNKAMLRIAAKIERNQQAQYISRFLYNSPFRANRLQQMKQAPKDSLTTAFENYWLDQSGNIHIVDKANNKETITIDASGNQTITYDFDTVITRGNSQQYIQTFSSVTKGNPFGTVKRIKPNGQEEVIFIKEQLSDVIDQMVIEFAAKDMSIEERLGHNSVASFIDAELKTTDLPKDYEYAITDYWGNLYSHLSSDRFDIRKLKEAYTTRLFPNQLGKYGENLRLYFPNKREYIFGSILWPFIGSLIFTAIILLTFSYTLRIIFNQKKVSEIKSDFINNMTHEFKTPIATISLAADSIANPNILTNPEKVSRFTQIIKEENNRMNRQVESVLKMSMIDKKDFNLQMNQTSVHPLIERAVKNISIQIEQKGGHVATNLTAEFDEVMVDETHFSNILFNLLENANKYSLNGPPKILVSSHNNQDNLYISVNDQGIGMDKDTQEHIFEKFYRVPTGNVHTVKGFGLGLSYVKAITMQFNGDIKVNSIKGKGSTFEIRIPLVKN